MMNTIHTLKAATQSTWTFLWNIGVYTYPLRTYQDYKNYTDSWKYN